MRMFYAFASAFTAQFLLIFKYLLITCFQTNKQMKTGGKNNSCVTIDWKVFCLACDAKDCKHYIFPSKIYKSSVKESKRLRTKWTMCCRKLPVVNCTHKSL